jgi:hypothetical protein
VARWRRPNWSHAADATSFLVGLAGVLHETWLSHDDRSSLLWLFGAMMTVPGFRGVDRRRQGRNEDQDEE